MYVLSAMLFEGKCKCTTVLSEQALEQLIFFIHQTGASFVWAQDNKQPFLRHEATKAFGSLKVRRPDVPI